MITIIITLNDIITAGIAVTAFSLFLYALAFNLRNQVARSFALLMLVVMTIYSAEAIAGSSQSQEMVALLMTVQWLGIIWLPAAYTRFSKSLLSTTGISVRRFIYWYSFVFSLFFTGLLFNRQLVGGLVQSNTPAPHLQSTTWSLIFTIYYGFTILLSLYNVYRAHQRTNTTTMRRRMSYLLLGSAAPAVGAFPYLLYGSVFAQQSPFFFWLLAFLLNVFTGIFIVIMAYSVAFFGVSLPDRVVKSRLMRWLLRGPITAVFTLAIVTIVRRMGQYYGISYNAFVPISMVISILLLEYLITIFGNRIQHFVFYGPNNAEVEELEALQNRLVTEGDLHQFMEMTLGAIRELTRANSAFISAVDGVNLKRIAVSGEIRLTVEENVPRKRFDPFPEFMEFFHSQTIETQFAEELYTLIPLYAVMNTGILINNGNGHLNDQRELVGMVGLEEINLDNLEEDQDESMSLLLERITIALQDRRAQMSIFKALRNLSHEMDAIQDIRANAHFSPASLIQKISSDEQAETNQGEMSRWVKEALTHYWGGPKLSENPLNQFRIVQLAKTETDSSNVNGLRNVLRNGIEKMRPQGQQRFTNDWLLYNILEMKYVSGKKVREIAALLSISEADYFRKQRVAIDELTRIILTKETELNSTNEE